MRERYKGRFPASQADRQSLKQKQELKREQERLEDAYHSLFAGLGGPEDAKMVLDDLMEFCLVGRTTMTGNSWTYFNEGKRAVGERIRQFTEGGRNG